MNLALRNRLLKFFVKASVLKLTFVGTVVYVVTALIFAAIYFVVDGVDSVDGSQTMTVFDYLDFSFTTQTTTGYGNLFPVELGKVVFMLHSIIGIAIPSVLTGLVVTKLLLPSQSGLRVSKYVVFYPDKKRFRFRLFNTQQIPLEEVRFFVRFRTPSAPDSIILDQYDVSLRRTFAPLLIHNNVYLVTTTPAGPKDAKGLETHDGAQVEAVLSPGHIDRHSTVLLQIRGIFYQSNYISTVDFDFTKIRCGQFEIIQDHPPEINHKNIDRYRRVAEEICSKCEFWNSCQLEDKWC